MRIGTKLVLLLTLAVGAVMLAASFLSLRQRETALEAALGDELRAHAVTLRLALEDDYARGRAEEAQQLIDRLRENTRIYAVLLFDETGGLLALSQTATAADFRYPPELATVLQTGEAREFVRQVENRKFLSIILPLRVGGGKRGALEIVKPLALIETDIGRARFNWAATTLLLLAVSFLVVLMVLQRNLSNPIRGLLAGAEALGRGDFDYRVPLRAQSKDELAGLAAEFNRMADGLAEHRETARREALDRLNLEKELRHSERLASVGRLAAGIAHELGAPLNVIDARAEQLLDNPTAAPEKKTRNLTIIREQTARIAHLVRQLLTLARPYNLRPAPIALADLLKSVLEQFEPETENKRIEIEFVAAPAAIVRADAEYLRQAFVNICRNAVQAMPAGGELKIEIAETARDNKDFVRVEIADTGGGIAPEISEKIFDPFYTTKDVGQGTGLGLAITRRIVEEHGGIIEAANNHRGGASFTIYLPKPSEPPSAET